MRALIGIGGSLKDSKWIKAEVSGEGFDLIIAADSGAAHILDLDLVPGMFLGDMDSVSKETSAHLRELGVETYIYEVRKDGSDTELAVCAAIEKGAGEIVLLGSFGQGRPDHLLANVLMLEGMIRQYPKIRIILTDGLSFVQAIRGPFCGTFTFRNMPEVPYVVSLLPISRKICGVTYKGLSFALDQADLERGTSRAISNYAVDREAGFSISLMEGSALVVMTPEE